MITHKLIDQFQDTGIATVQLGQHPQKERLRHGVTQMSIANARALLRGAGTSLGAKVRTRSAEHQKYQGVTHVIGEIVHGAVDDRGCYICRKAGERLGRIAWLWEFRDPLISCTGWVRRIVNDDPEQGLELSAGSLTFADAERAAGFLTIGRKVDA